MPQILELKATRKEDGVERVAKYNYDVGANIEEAVALYGAPQVHNVFVKGLRVATQAAAANYQVSGTGKSPEEVQTYMDSWKPGMKVERAAKAPADPVAALLKRFEDGSMSDEEKQAVFAKVRDAMPKKGRN